MLYPLFAIPDTTGTKSINTNAITAFTIRLTLNKLIEMEKYIIMNGMLPLHHQANM